MKNVAETILKGCNERCMAMIDRPGLAAAIEEFRPLLRNDGGDLELAQIDEEAGQIDLTVVIGEQACVDCIIEPQMLREIIVEFFAGKRIPGIVRIVVHDPRIGKEA